MNAKRIAIGLSVVVLALLLGVRGGKRGVFALLERAMVGPSHERWVSQFDILGVEPGDTVFLGDSLTEYGAWHELFPQTPVRNRGIVGDRTAGVIARLDQITQREPAQVFVMIGTNDLFSGVPQPEIVANVLRIVETIRGASPGTDVFVQSVLPRGARFQERVESLNAALEVAVAGRATWVDLYPLFLDQAGTSLDDALTNDELHLSGRGYLVWRDAIGHLVERQAPTSLPSGQEAGS